MFDKIKNKIQEGKDGALSMAIETALKHTIGKYGNVQNFNIDTKSHTINAQIQLLGETETSEILIEGYSFTFEDNQCGVKFDKIKTSKEWFNLLASDFLVGKIIPINNSKVCSGLKIFF